MLFLKLCNFKDTAPPQKPSGANSQLFLNFVTYDRKMPKFFSFSNTP